MKTNKPFKILEVDFKKGIFRMSRPPETMEERLEMEMAVNDALVRNMIREDDHIIYPDTRNQHPLK